MDLEGRAVGRAIGRLVAVVVLASTVVGCTAVMPPVRAPDPVPPDVGQMPPLEDGRGRVIVDVTDGPTEVRRWSTSTVSVELGKGDYLSASATGLETLCTSPCVLDLPVGRHVLAFPIVGGGRRVETDVVDFGAQTMVYRRTLGTFEGAGAGLPLGILGTTFGAIAAVVGIVLLPVGLATDTDGMTIAGAINLGVGAALMTVGIVGIAMNPNVERPGASVTFALD